MKKLLLVCLALSCQPVAAQTAEYRQVGALAPGYVFNLACAEEVGAPRSAFINFKRQVARDFGQANAQRLQSYYNEARAMIERTRPSDRAHIAHEMNCLDNAADLASRIRANWRDGIWLTSQRR